MHMGSSEGPGLPSHRSIVPPPIKKRGSAEQNCLLLGRIWGCNIRIAFSKQPTLPIACLGCCEQKTLMILRARRVCLYPSTLCRRSFRGSDKGREGVVVRWMAWRDPAQGELAPVFFSSGGRWKDHGDCGECVLGRMEIVLVCVCVCICDQLQRSLTPPAPLLPICTVLSDCSAQHTQTMRTSSHTHYHS